MLKPRELDFSRFAFQESSPWGLALQAFLRASFDRSGSEKTLAHYQRMLTDFFSNPALMPDCYSRFHVEAFVHAPGQGKGREGRAVSPGTLNNRLSIVSSFYSYSAGYTIADEQGVVRPVLRIPAPTLGIRQVKTATSPRVLSAGDVEKLLASIPKDTERGLKYRALWITFLFTARRSSEILELRWKDLERVTVVEQGIQRDEWKYHFYGKGNKRFRDVAPLPGPAITAILAYLSYGGRLATMEPDDAVFCADTSYHGKYGYDPKRTMKQQTVWEALKGFARMAGIDESAVTIHTWRHCSAQMRFSLGEDLFSLSHTLRHQNISTTHIYLAGLTTTTDTGAKLLESRFANL